MTTDSTILSNLVKRMKKRDRDPLRPLLDEYLIKRDASPVRYTDHGIEMVPRGRPGGRLSPSTIGGCLRQSAFKFLAVKGRRRLDPDTELVFDDGNWRHHKWDAIFKDMQAVLGPEKFEVVANEEGVTYPKLYIAGHLDNVVKLNGVKYVEDTKGINEMGFSRIYTADEPKTEHVDQLHSYMKMRGVFTGLLHYDNKNDQRTRTFVVQFEPSRWEAISEWCNRVLVYLRNRELPPMHPECEAGNYLYERCPYSSLCYGSKSEGEVEALVYKNFKGVKASWKRGIRDES